MEMDKEMEEKDNLIEHLKCDPFLDEGNSGALLLPPMCDPPEMTQGYGENPNAYGGMGMPIHSHNGIDWALDEGTPIRASHDGYVFDAYHIDEDGYHGYGNHIKLRQKDGNSGFETVYAHLSKMVVTEGDYVKKGQLIGYSGDTGYSTKPHVHFGLRFLYYCDVNDDIGQPCEVLYEDNGNLGWIDPTPYMHI